MLKELSRFLDSLGGIGGWGDGDPKVAHTGPTTLVLLRQHTTHTCAASHWHFPYTIWLA